MWRGSENDKCIWYMSLMKARAVITVDVIVIANVPDGPCGFIESNRAKSRKNGSTSWLAKQRQENKNAVFFIYIFITVWGKSLYTHIEKPSLWVCMEILGCMTTKYYVNAI